MPKARKRRPISESWSEKAGPAILQDLVLTEKAFTEIAEKHRVPMSHVTNVNKLYEARPTGLVKSIAAGLQGNKSRNARRKLFTNRQKEALLREHIPGIAMVAKEKWKADETIRVYYGGQFKWFLNEMLAAVSEALDLYDPSVRGADGKTASVFSWMMKNARYFSKHMENREIPKIKKAKRHLSEKGIRQKILDNMRPSGLKWIPIGAKGFLRELGINVELAAKLGFEDIERQLIGIIELKAVLTPEEKWLARQRLAGKTLEELGKEMGLTKQAIGLRSIKVAKKIKRALPSPLEK